MRHSGFEQVEEVLRPANVAHRQEATLGSASVITFACAALYMSVQLLILCKSRFLCTLKRSKGSCAL